MRQGSQNVDFGHTYLSQHIIDRSKPDFVPECDRTLVIKRNRIEREKREAPPCSQG